MAKGKIVVLCSGGMNSTVAATIAKHSHTLALLHVRFGHRAAEREAELFEKQTEFFGVKDQIIVDMPHFAQIGGNARVNRKLQVEDAMAVGESKANTYIPGLITTLLGVGFTWASAIGATRISLGVSEDLGPPGPRTSSIYHDFSRDHIDLCREALAVASYQNPITIDTPLIDLSRTEIVKLGNRVGAPLELTWSCLSSGNQPCGACVGCATRNRGFLDAGLPDPILCAEPAAT